MKPAKTFDCVQMKHDIQKRLRREYAGLSVAERSELIRRKILADPILGPWFERVSKTVVQPSVVAETPAPYRARRRK